MLDAFDAVIDMLEDPTLAGVSPILEEYGIAYTVLDAIGYTVDYTTLNQAEATVRKRQ